jgi:excisionase family DNA binding protein
VSRQTVYTWLAEGTLKAHKVGAHRRILLLDLERLKRSRGS